MRVPPGGVTPVEETRRGERSWDEFRASGLLWWINRSLHLFGWSLVAEINERGEVVRVYPARVAYRGFDPEDEARGFVMLTAYLSANGRRLVEDVHEEPPEGGDPESTPGEVSRRQQRGAAR